MTQTNTSKSNISKQQLIDLLKSWGEQKIDAEKLQEWMIHNYDLDETDVGRDEPEWTQEAMNIVMNEYEIAKLAKMRQENYKLAIEFINADEMYFNQARHLFLHEGFSD